LKVLKILMNSIDYKLINSDRRIFILSYIKTFLDSLEDSLSKQLEDLNNRALGGLNNKESPTYKSWSEIYKNAGWIEVKEYQCFYNPLEVIDRSKYPGGFKHPVQSYDYDMAMLIKYSNYEKYLNKWKSMVLFLESDLFDKKVLDLPYTTFNEALFIVMGFNPKLLRENIAFNDFSMFAYTPTYEEDLDPAKFYDPEGNERLFHFHKLNIIENEICKLDEFLSLSRRFKNYEINTSEFIAWAVKEGRYLLTYQANYRLLEQSLAEELHNLLIKEKLIDLCCFEDTWVWIRSDVLLSYLIIELYNNLIINETPFKVILAYIKQTGKTDLERKGYYIDPPKHAASVNNVILQLKKSKK